METFSGVFYMFKVTPIFNERWLRWLKWLRGNGLRPKRWCAASIHEAARMMYSAAELQNITLRRFQILCAAPTPWPQAIPPQPPCPQGITPQTLQLMLMTSDTAQNPSQLFIFHIDVIVNLYYHKSNHRLLPGGFL